MLEPTNIYTKNLTNDVEAINAKYWLEYASLDTWQFWINVVFLILPLIVLFLKIDRSKIFQILFFGYTIHVLMNYFDMFAVRGGLVFHPYKLIPFTQINLSINTSLIPVFFMLMYQYAINHQKNIFLIAFAASVCTGILLGAFADITGLIKMYKIMNVGFIFITDFIEFLLAYWLTCFFLKLMRNKVIN